MRDLLKTEPGRAEYDKRKIAAEAAFGQIKSARGFAQFLLRPLGSVQAESKAPGCGAQPAHALLSGATAGRRLSVS